MLWPRSTSSPVRLLSSSPGLFLAASCGMRVLLAPPGRPSEIGEGVSGSVELGLCERDESEWLCLPPAGWLISPRLEDFSMPWFTIIIFFITMGLSGGRSGKAPGAGGSPGRLAPLGVGALAGWPGAASSMERVSSVGRAASSLGAELGTRWCSLGGGMDESESQRVKSLR